MSQISERLGTALIMLGLAAAYGRAAPVTSVQTADAPTSTVPASALRPFAFLDNIERSSALLGDMWGLRQRLGQAGMTLQVQETSEILGNVSGGRKRGTVYDGLTTATLQLDTQRAFGWQGGTFNVSGLQIHGRNLSATNLLSLQTASGITATPATRLWELWYQQKFGADGDTDLRIGQQSLDQEFMVSQNALVFVNTMFGWPMVPSADLPGGGPAYPLSALGARGRVRLDDRWTALLGAFNGNPASNRTGDSQSVNRSGTGFPLNGGALFIGELQYSYPGPNSVLYPDQPEPKARSYRVGFWYHNAGFDDLRYDTQGNSLASSASTGVARAHRGNFSLYAVADQIVWQDPTELDRTLSAFLRVMGTPQTDRNLVDFSLNAGLVVREPILHRDDDIFGIGIGYAHVSRRAAGFDRDSAASGDYVPTRSGEAFIELTYQYQVAPWLQLQPDFQYVFNPGGGLADPDRPRRRIRDEAVLGLRSIIQF